MTISELRQLFSYGAWANALVFDAAAALSDEQFNHTFESSFPSVGGTLAHIVAAEWIWLRRWLGESPSSFPDWTTRPVLADLKGRLSGVEREREAYVARLSEADLGRPFSYRTLAGQELSTPLGGLLLHVVNHSTYHRGQVATLLRQLGQKPPSTDLVLFLRQAT